MTKSTSADALHDSKYYLTTAFPLTEFGQTVHSKVNCEVLKT